MIDNQVASSLCIAGVCDMLGDEFAKQCLLDEKRISFTNNHHKSDGINGKPRLEVKKCMK